MGSYVDIAAMRASAGRVAAAADELRRAAPPVLSFDAPGAGREWFAEGARLRRVVGAPTGDLGAAAQASYQLAIELCRTADHYIDAEDSATARIG